MRNKKTIAVIGSGPMGLMCAYELLKQGHEVTIFERDDRIGGMSASFDLDGKQIERFYHFVCATDYPLFALLKELNIYSKLKWRETKMGFYYEGKLYSWGDPFSLLKFPKLSLLEKIRYGLHVLYAKNVKNWQSLDQVNAITWLQKWLGKNAYQVLWDKLFHLKFYEHQHDLSAAWIGARIQRVAKSRKSIFKESMGYLEGGSEALLSAMQEKIFSLGGKIQLRANVTAVVSGNALIQGVQIDDKVHSFDTVISTIPMPYVPKLVPELSENLREQISSIANVGVACVVLKLKQAISPYFWTNTNHPGMEIPGVIEYSNLTPFAGNVVYVPYYMPQSHPKYKYTDAEFVAEVCGYLNKINPNFSASWVIASNVARYAYAQTVCSTGFYGKIPPMKTNISGFYMADTSYYYPEDRSISESVKVGKELASCVEF